MEICHSLVLGPGVAETAPETRRNQLGIPIQTVGGEVAVEAKSHLPLVAEWGKMLVVESAEASRCDGR